MSMLPFMGQDVSELIGDNMNEKAVDMYPQTIKNEELPADKAEQVGKEEELVCMEIGWMETRKQTNPGNDDCLLDKKLDHYFLLLITTLVGMPNAGSCSTGPLCVPRNFKPYNAKVRQFGNDWPPYGFTMVGRERLMNFRNAILEVNQNNILGAIAEFGVWRGGGMIMATAVQKHSSTATMKRDLYVFDAFGEIKGYGNKASFLSVSLEEVQNHFRYFGLLEEENLHFVEGLFNNTVVEWVTRDDPIAVLRVDGNFYSSYQDVLYAVYENVPAGGIVIFDDVMSHPGIMKCWEDFKGDQELPENLVQIDKHSAWFRKRKVGKIDQSKKKMEIPNEMFFR